MVKRNIVKIDEEKCNDCGKCVIPCAESAIQMVNGKAKVVSDELCDKMGFCVGVCPTGALTIEQRDTVVFNQEKAEFQEKDTDSTINCFIYGWGEFTGYLSHDMESIWVCTQCLPKLIHC